jgi:hypothetical protein
MELGQITYYKVWDSRLQILVKGSSLCQSVDDMLDKTLLSDPVFL